MLDYTNNSMRDVFTQIKIGQNGQDDVSIDRVLKVEKTGSGAVNYTENEIWPGPALQLFLTTNYDQRVSITPPDSAYEVPYINPADNGTNPLQITVVPEPANAAWKLRCSSNMSLPLNIRDVVFHGTQTVSIQLDYPSGNSGEFRWIEAYPAYENVVLSDMPRFRFYVPANSSGGGSSGGGGEGTTPGGSGAAYFWNFNEGANFLVDSIQGVSLQSYKNFESPTDHVLTAVDGAPTSSALSAHYYADPGTTHVYIDSTVYDRSSANDTGEYKAWYNADATPTTYWTASDTPAAGSSVYDENSTEITGTTVADYFTDNGNIFEAHTTNASGTEDQDTDVTLSFYFRIKSQGILTFGGNRFIWNDGNRAVLNETSGYGIIGQYDPPGDWIATKTKGWMHIAIVFSKLATPGVDADWNAERGWGIEIIYGLKFGSWGASVGPYVRDAASDADGRYAWRYLTDSNLNTKAPAETDPLVVWTDASPAEMAYNSGVTAWKTSTSTANSDKIGMWHYPYKWRWRCDLFKPYKHNGQVYEGDLPYYTDYETQKATNSNAPQARRLCVLYKNGAYATCSISRFARSPYGVFRIQFNGVGNYANSNLDAFDDIKISRYAYTEEEALAEAVTIGATPGEAAAAAASLPKDPKAIITPKAAWKITVGSGVYIYNPLLTVYRPVAADKKAARFGWELFSGTGAEPIYTDKYDPEAGDACYSTANADSADLTITLAEELDKNEVPLKLPLTPYIIDNQTIAIIADTHDFIEQKCRTYFPDMEALHWLRSNNKLGYESYITYGTMHIPEWHTHGLFQTRIRNAMDNVSNFSVDGNAVTLAGRWWICTGLFHFSGMQWRNCKKGDVYYVDHDMCANAYSTWHPTGDYGHVAYLRLPTPMAEGSTHTVSWLGNTCTVTYDRDHASSAIKVNQEGYAPWNHKKYAYMGTWLGSGGGYTPTISDFHFYVMPVELPSSISNAVFSGVMTQRSSYGTTGGNGLCSDSWSNGMPVDGENTYQCDFSDIDSATRTKTRITVGGTYFFRDATADYMSGSFQLVGTTYTRAPQEDTCYAYAWKTNDPTAVSQKVWTDTCPPESGSGPSAANIMHPWSGDTAYLDNELKNVAGRVTDVTYKIMYGWTTERVTEASYGTAVTCWTDFDGTGGVISGGSAPAYMEDGTVGTATDLTANVTTHDISGEYQIYIPGIGWSYKFIIGNQGVGHAFWIFSRGMFHQRFGCNQKKHPYTNWEYDWGGHEPIFDGATFRDGSQANNTAKTWKVDPDTHEPILNPEGGKQPPTGNTSITGMNGEASGYSVHWPLYGVRGGWSDAADFDVRPEHLVNISALANAYIIAPQNFTDGQLDIPESGDGVPDILSEAIYGAEIYRRGQWEYGGVPTWYETTSHECDWEWKSKKKYFRVVGDMYGTLLYLRGAADLAYALKVAAQRATTEAAQKECLRWCEIYTHSCLRAWNYIERNTVEPYVMKPQSEVEPIYYTFKGDTYVYYDYLTLHKTGSFGGSDVMAYLAAVAMFRLTREPRFRGWITNSAATRRIAWDKNNENYLGQYIPWGLFVDLKNDFPDVAAAEGAYYISRMNTWIGYMEQNTYRIFNWPVGSRWSNALTFTQHPDCRGPALIAAWLASGDHKYIDAMANAMDHMAGCTATGKCWTNWLGKVWQPRHNDSWFPRAIPERNMWSVRPGISPYRMDQSQNYGNGYNPQNISIAPKSGEIWNNPFGYAGTSYDLYPAQLSSLYGASSSTLKGVLNAHMPQYRYHTCFETERIYNDCSEYTVFQTMVWKMAMQGILMGPGFKPRFWYKQIAPARSHMSNPNHVFLP